MSNASPTQMPAPAAAPSQNLSEKQMLKALSHHQEGRLKEAEEYYRQVLRLFPDHPDANNLLGVLLFQTGKSKDGLQFLDRAVSLKPKEAMFYYNYGVALRAAGEQAKSIEMLGKCIQLKPDQVDAVDQLAQLFEKRHDWEQAIKLLQMLVALKPLEPKGFRRLGELLHNAKRFSEAVGYFNKAIGLDGNDSHLHHQLGMSLQALDDKPNAINAYRRCLELNANVAPAHNNLAILLAEMNDYPAAVKHYEESLRINPGLFQTKCNLGGLFRKTEQYDQSIQWLRSAVDQKPDCGEAWCNLGNTYGDLGETLQAMDCYRRAILNQPDYAQARLNRAIGLLRLERFEDGWLEYEWRYKLKECPKRNLPKPRWDGSPLGSKTLLMHAEQGLGDTLQMARYVKHLVQAGSKVVLECQKALVPLLTLSSVASQVVALGDKHPDYDLQIPLMSAPSVMFQELGFLSSAIPYIQADGGRLQQWQQLLAEVKGLKVGVFWQGNPDFKMDHLRSIPLSEFAPLLQVPDIRLISLQKGKGTEQLSEFSDKIIQFQEMDSAGGAFMDSTAILQCLDVLVTSDSAIAHLAGALGVRTLLMLPFAADWRWFVERTDCPWYPNTTLIRKPQSGSWKDVIEQVCQLLVEAT